MSRPTEGGKASQLSEVRLVYNNTAVYVGAMLFDSAPDSVLKELGLRDGADPSSNSGFTDINADYFRFVVDPYNTRQDAYDFGVYASGVQTDSRFSDYLFDAVWNSAVQINDSGWVVEMEIPYSAIRFPKKPVQEWALQFTRNIKRIREFDQWNLTPSTAYNSQDYWATLNGIANVKPPIRLSLTPYVSVAYERVPVVNDEGNSEISNAFSYRGGADIKYGLDERFTLDMTLLPDFGQVQSDNKIKSLSYEEVNYDENRPFFKEGTDIFSKDGLFYTRRIGQFPTGFSRAEDQLMESEEVTENPTSSKLLNATKVSGRTDKGLGIGVFNAITNNTYSTLRNTVTGLTRKVLTEPLTNYNVVVLDKQWKNNSSVYLINSNVSRSKKFNDANVTGTGFTFINKKNTYGTDGSFSLSQQISKSTEDAKGETELGYRYFFGIRKTSGTLRWGISRSGVDAKFNRTDLGYYAIQNREVMNAYLTLYRFKTYKKVQEGNTEFSSNYNTRLTNGKRGFFEVRNNSFLLFTSGNAIFSGVGFTPLTCNDYDPRLNGRYFKSLRYWYAYVGGSSDYRKKLAVDFTQNMSNFSDRFKSEGYNTDLVVRYRFNDKLTLQTKFSNYRDPFNVGYVDQTGDNSYLFGGRKTNTFIHQISARYIFKNDLSLSISARHYWFNVKYRAFFNVEEDGELVSTADEFNGGYDFSYNYFNADLLFSWRFAPGSTLSISYKNIFEAADELTSLSYRKDAQFVFDNPHAQTFSIKVLYYLDYLQLKKKS